MFVIVHKRTLKRICLLDFMYYREAENYRVQYMGNSPYLMVKHVPDPIAPTLVGQANSQQEVTAPRVGLTVTQFTLQRNRMQS